eukprot:g6200.t1
MKAATARAKVEAATALTIDTCALERAALLVPAVQAENEDAGAEKQLIARVRAFQPAARQQLFRALGCTPPFDNVFLADATRWIGAVAALVAKDRAATLDALFGNGGKDDGQRELVDRVRDAAPAIRARVLRAAGCPPPHDAALLADDGRWARAVAGLVEAWRRETARARFRKGGVRAANFMTAAKNLSKPERVWGFGKNDHGQLGTGATQAVTDHPESSQNSPVALEAFRGVPVRLVACGALHTVVATADGDVFAFGCNDKGQLGLGHQTPACVRAANAAPQRVPRLCGGARVRVREIVCGAYHTVALVGGAGASAGGAAYAWGANESGQLGLGSTAQAVPAPQEMTQLAGLPVGAVACGDKHTIIVLDFAAADEAASAATTARGSGNSGGASERRERRERRRARRTPRVWTCGSNDYGQLGTGGRIGCNALAPVPLPARLFEPSAAGAALADGGDDAPEQEQERTRADGVSSWVISVTHVAAGASFSMVALEACPRRRKGSQGGRGGGGGGGGGVTHHVLGWGDNGFGQLGLQAACERARPRRLGAPTHEAEPRRSRALSGRAAALLRCGAHHTLAVFADGEVWGCGSNIRGNLGAGRPDVRGVTREAERDLGTARRAPAQRIDALCRDALSEDEAEAEALYEPETDAERAAAQARARGRAPTVRSNCVRVGGLVALECGAAHCVGVCDSGGLLAWGSNAFGQLGIGPHYARYQPGPVHVQGLPTHVPVLAARMSCSSQHSFVFTPHGARALPEEEQRPLERFEDVLEEPPKRRRRPRAPPPAREASAAGEEEPPTAEEEERAPAANAQPRPASRPAGSSSLTSPVRPRTAPTAADETDAESVRTAKLIDSKLAAARAKAEAQAKGLDDAQTAALIARRTAEASQQ